MWFSGLVVLPADAKLALTSALALKLPEWKKHFLKHYFPSQKYKEINIEKPSILQLAYVTGYKTKDKRYQNLGVSPLLYIIKEIWGHSGILYLGFILSWTLCNPQRTAMTKSTWIKRLIIYLKIFGKNC